MAASWGARPNPHRTAQLLAEQGITTMSTMTHPTNYQMVDRITPVRRPAKRPGPGKRAVTAMCLLCIGAAGTGVGIGTVIATLLGLR